jgi:hypothetical protein
VDLIQWANDYGFADVLSSNLPPPPNFDVAEQIAGVSEDCRGWWPEIGEQHHEPREKPSRQSVALAHQILIDRWATIVGPELAAATRVVRFTGRRMRRLCVAADPAVTPPWGSWFSARSNPRAFTVFRRAINEAIAPMEVDDVTFLTQEWQPPR